MECVSSWVSSLHASQIIPCLVWIESQVMERVSTSEEILPSLVCSAQDSTNQEIFVGRARRSIDQVEESTRPALLTRTLAWQREERSSEFVLRRVSCSDRERCGAEHRTLLGALLHHEASIASGTSLFNASREQRQKIVERGVRRLL